MEFSGQLGLVAAGARGRTVLLRQSFCAPYHLGKPYWDPDAEVLVVQVVNPTAGILSGDRLRSEISVGPGGSLLVTTPSASRVFRMNTGVAECRQVFSVEPGGWLEVMPEPLVLHRGSRFRQHTEISVAPGGGLFYVDTLMPGRLAHGEAWGWDQLDLVCEVRVGGGLVLRERCAHTGPELRALAELAGSGAGACFANAVLVCEHQVGDSWRTPLQALHGSGIWIGVSALAGPGWSIKVVAQDGIALRRCFKEVRRILSGTLPRLACDPRKL